MTLTSIVELLQTLQGLDHFKANGIKYDINIVNADFENAMNLCLADSAEILRQSNDNMETRAHP